MILKLGVKHQGQELYKVYINHDLDLFYNKVNLGRLKAKLHVEHPWEGGKKVYINVQGHMTKMAAIAINRKKT